MLTHERGPYQRVLQQLHRADLLSRRVADQHLFETIGIGRAMFLVLEALVDAGSSALSQRDIADQLGLTKAAVSRHIAAGRDQGLLHADAAPKTRRQNSVVLTPKGRQLVARGRRQRGVAERRIIADIGVVELDHTAQVLERLCLNFESTLRAH